MANYDIPQYPTKRLRYFNNQFLNDQDFIDDDAAQIGHERAVLRSLWVAGVCEGLLVTYPAPNKPPSVSAGIAIDKAGCMIVIDQPTDGLANPSALADGDYFVHISFLESADNKATGQGAADYTRWKQTPVINATAKAAALPDGAVVLGSCTVTGGAFVGSGTTVGRQYSGLRLPGPNKDAAATLRTTGASDDLLMFTGSLMIRRDAPGQIGPTLTLLNASGGPNAATAIDFANYDPGTNDPSARVLSLDDNFSSHLTFSTKQPGASTNKLVERLRITSTGNVGIGTQAPNDILHVRAADTVGLLESSTTQAALRLTTSEGMGNHIELANRPGGRAAIWVGTAGDALLVNKDGSVVVSKAQGGVGDLTVENYLRFPNDAPKDKIVMWDKGSTDRFGIGLNSSNLNLFCPTGSYFSLRQNSATGAEFFSVSATGTARFYGPIIPKLSSDASGGIYFPNPGGSSGDEAFLRYSVTPPGNIGRLVLGINGLANDALVLWQAGVERLTIANNLARIANALAVDGDIQLSGKHAFRGNDGWLRLNQDGAFPNGVHTPGNFLPGSLNVGGANSYTGNPGTGNAWIAGTLQVFGSTTLSDLTVNNCLLFPNSTHQNKIVLYEGYGLGMSDANISLFCTPGAYFSVRQSSWGGAEVFTVDGGNGSVRSNGSVTATGFNNTSDLRLKRDVETLTGALQKVQQLRAVSFRWRDDEPSLDGAKEKTIGMIAQEVQAVLPGAVLDGKNDELCLNYQSITALLVEAIKDQDVRINTLEQRLAAQAGKS